MNRRGFLLGLGALVAAPAIVRADLIMPISTRFTPLYVPIDWLYREYGMAPFQLGAPALTVCGTVFADLKQHGWSRPMADNWINVNDYDPGYVRAWFERERDQDWFTGYT